MLLQQLKLCITYSVTSGMSAHADEQLAQCLVYMASQGPHTAAQAS
jgi:hypothetical protein